MTDTTFESGSGLLSDRLLNVLRCPECHEAFAGASGSDELRCRCGLRVPIRDGIPRFVPDDGYAASFSWEWHRYNRTQLDSASGDRRSEAQFAEMLGKPLEWLRGKLVLDAGCGMGRYAEIAARYGANVVAMDFSYAVDEARRNLAKLPNVTYVQADINRPPFAPGTFDVAYSLGVLHHTPDAHAAFLKVASLVKPDGWVSMFVYSRYNRVMQHGSDIWRHLTTRMPKSILYLACAAAIPLYYVYSLPGLGWIGNVCVPISMDRQWRWRWLDTFDWYSPKYQSKHTHAEVGKWFQEAGLSDITIADVDAIAMAGRKRATPAAAEAA